MLRRKLIAIGSSVGLILPKEALAHPKAEEEDAVFLSEDRDGFRMTSVDPEIGKTMESTRKI